MEYQITNTCNLWTHCTEYSVLIRIFCEGTEYGDEKGPLLLLLEQAMKKKRRRKEGHGWASSSLGYSLNLVALRLVLQVGIVQMLEISATPAKQNSKSFVCASFSLRAPFASSVLSILDLILVLYTLYYCTVHRGGSSSSPSFSLFVPVCPGFLIPVPHLNLL